MRYERLCIPIVLNSWQIRFDFVIYDLLLFVPHNVRMIVNRMNMKMTQFKWSETFGNICHIYSNDLHLKIFTSNLRLNSLWVLQRIFMGAWYVSQSMHSKWFIEVEFFNWIAANRSETYYKSLYKSHYIPNGLFRFESQTTSSRQAAKYSIGFECFLFHLILNRKLSAKFLYVINVSSSKQ